MEYTKRRNLNRGYMKLEVWQRAMDLFVMAFGFSVKVGDLKLKSQFRDAAQSVSANIAEGYGRRSLPEYIQFLYTAKGSLAEALTRAIGLLNVKILSNTDFEKFDKLHYEVENKLLRLIGLFRRCRSGAADQIRAIARIRSQRPILWRRYPGRRSQSRLPGATYISPLWGFGLRLRRQIESFRQRFLTRE